MFVKSPKNKDELKNQRNKLQKAKLGIFYYLTVIIS